MAILADNELMCLQIQFNPSVVDPSSAYLLVEMLLPLLTNEQRVSLFSGYCAYCGSDDPRCQCDNDE
jgi:hypothetical protein